VVELRASVEPAASAERVWEAATDWAAQGQWIPLTTTHVVDTRADGAATRLDAWTGVGPVGFHDHMIVRVWEPPHRLVLEHVGRVVRGSAGFDIAPITPELCRVEWWERLDPPLGVVGAVALRIARPALTVGLRATLRRLARLAESRH
jgi:hypothetical protein